MRWFLNLHTRSKLLLSFGVMLLFLAVVSVTAYTHLTALQRSQRRLFAEDFANATDFALLMAHETEIRVAVLQMLVATQPAERDA